MSELEKQISPVKALSNFMNGGAVKSKFEEVLGKNSSGFVSSVLTICSQNDNLSKSTPESVYSAALMAATLNLPLNQSLGFAYIVPFNNRSKGVQEAQFQIGYKGLTQLAMRTGQLKSIGATPIYEGQIVSQNPLFGTEFDFNIPPIGSPIGYASGFKLINGFEKIIYMSVEEVNEHAKKYSQSFRKGYGVWKDDYPAMASKTVLKKLLSKYAPMNIELQSVELQKAITSDGGVLNDSGESIDIDYSDNVPMSISEKADEKEVERISKKIEEAKDIDSLESLKAASDAYQLAELFNQKKSQLLDNG